MLYLYAKSLHIIFMVCWMAGLFYMPRLFVYHTEARQKTGEEFSILHQQFIVMERRLWWVITTPAMYITIASGAMLLYLSPGFLDQPWMHIKLTFVGCLVAYHFKTQHLMHLLAKLESKWTSSQLRLWNEVSTIILFAVVFLVIFRSAVDWVFGVIGLVGLALFLMILMKLYKRYRKSKGQKVD